MQSWWVGVCTEGHRKNPPSHLMHIFYNSKYSNSVLAHADSAACFGVNEFALRKHCCKLPFFVLIVGYLRISNHVHHKHARTYTQAHTNQPTDSINNFRIANIAKESVWYYSEVGIFRLRPDLKPQSNSHVYTLENSNSNNSSTSSSSVFSLNAYEIVIAKYRYTEAYPFWRQ